MIALIYLSCGIINMFLGTPLSSGYERCTDRLAKPLLHRYAPSHPLSWMACKLKLMKRYEKPIDHSWSMAETFLTITTAPSSPTHRHPLPPTHPPTLPSSWEEHWHCTGRKVAKSRSDVSQITNLCSNWMCRERARKLKIESQTQEGRNISIIFYTYFF